MSDAKNLIENENLKKQSLELFKNWLAKHPFISFHGNENIDDILLHFLRSKNFAMDKVYRCFEITLTHIKSNPKWYENLVPSDYECTMEPNSPILVLKNCDAEGRRVLIIRWKHFNTDNYHTIFRQGLVVPAILSYEPQTQLNGFVVIHDFRDFTLSNFTKIPVNMLYDGMKFIQNGSIKIKQMNFMELPSFMLPVIEVLKKTLSKKMIERFNFLQRKELSKLMDVSILPQEYGGSSDDLLEFDHFKPGFEYMTLLNKFEVNFSKIQNFENIGSFRKLEID